MADQPHLIQGEPEDEASVSWERFFIITTGITNGAHQSVVRIFNSVGQTEARSPEDADYCLVFCPVSSRVGTDLTDALDHLPDDKAAVLVVMHHTFNPEQVIPPSRRLVTDRRVRLTLDCIFYQNDLLSGEFNRKMKDEIKTFFRYKKKNRFDRLWNGVRRCCSAVLQGCYCCFIRNSSEETSIIGNCFARLWNGVHRCCSAVLQYCCFIRNGSEETSIIGEWNPNYGPTPEPQAMGDSDTTRTDHNASSLGQNGSN